MHVLLFILLFILLFCTIAILNALNSVACTFVAFTLSLNPIKHFTLAWFGVFVDCYFVYKILASAKSGLL